MSRIGKSTDTESRLVVAKVGGGLGVVVAPLGLTANRYRVWKSWKFWNEDGCVIQ